MTMNGETITELPEQGAYIVEVSCDKGTGSWDYDEWALVVKNFQSKTACSVNFKEILAVGSYVSMTPTSTSYTISSALTSSSDQTINPSLSTSWIVIRHNEDGTIDAVAEKLVASVSFYGDLGYYNLIGSLNTIANQFKNDTYVSSTRHVGYNGQSSIGKYDYSTSTSDDLYTTDIDLIMAAVGTLEAYAINPPIPRGYWLASRYSDGSLIGGRYVSASGTISDTLSNVGILYSASSSTGFTASYYIRPIVTFKAGIVPSSGSGTSDDPWVLE